MQCIAVCLGENTLRQHYHSGLSNYRSLCPSLTSKDAWRNKLHVGVLNRYEAHTVRLPIYNEEV